MAAVADCDRVEIWYWFVARICARLEQVRDMASEAAGGEYLELLVGDILARRAPKPAVQPELRQPNLVAPENAA